MRKRDLSGWMRASEPMSEREHGQASISEREREREREKRERE